MFDGDSIVVDAAGRLIARGPQFEDALVLADLDLPTAGPVLADGDTTADARDGTMITIQQLTLPAPEGAVEHGSTNGCRVARPFRGECSPRLDDQEEVYKALVTGRPRLCAQERLRLGDSRPLRRYRLSADRDHRGRRAWRGTGAHGADAEQVLERSFDQRRRGPGQEAGPARGYDTDRPHRGGSSRTSLTCTGWPQRTSRPASGAPS